MAEQNDGPSHAEEVSANQQAKVFTRFTFTMTKENYYAYHRLRSKLAYGIISRVLNRALNQFFDQYHQDEIKRLQERAGFAPKFEFDLTETQQEAQAPAADAADARAVRQEA